MLLARSRAFHCPQAKRRIHRQACGKGTPPSRHVLVMANREPRPPEQLAADVPLDRARSPYAPLGPELAASLGVDCSPSSLGVLADGCEVTLLYFPQYCVPHRARWLPKRTGGHRVTCAVWLMGGCDGRW